MSAFFCESVCLKLGIDIRDFQIILLHATRPTYLLFSRQDSSPKFVIKTGIADHLRSVYSRMAALYKLLPERIPKPISITDLGSGDAAFLQCGVVGSPWFDYCSRTRTRAGWEHISSAAIGLWTEFDNAVSSKQEWIRTIDPANQIKKLSEELLEKCTDFDLRLRDRVSTTAEDWGSGHTIQHHIQHGDFCLNNMILEKERGFRLIDFDDFGRVECPLFDAFSLAYSIHSRASAAVKWNSLEHNILSVVKTHFEEYSPNELRFLHILFLATSLKLAVDNNRLTMQQVYLDCLRRKIGDGPENWW